MFPSCYEQKGPSPLQGLVSVIKTQNECNGKFQLLIMIFCVFRYIINRHKLYRTRREACLKLTPYVNNTIANMFNQNEFIQTCLL